jgi:hypothetical protein
MVRDEAPAATTRGVNEIGEQLRCCGNPSGDRGQRASSTAGRTATFKLRATADMIDYCIISMSSGETFKIVKLASERARSIMPTL